VIFVGRLPSWLAAARPAEQTRRASRERMPEMMLSGLENHPLGSRLACARVVARVERRDRVTRAALRFCAEAEAREDLRLGRQVAIVWMPPAKAKQYLVSVWDAIFSHEAQGQEARL